MAVAAAVGLSAQARAEAIEQDSRKDLNAPSDDADKTALLAGASQHAAQAAEGPAEKQTAEATQARDAVARDSDVLIVLPDSGDIVGSDGTDALTTGSGESGPSHYGHSSQLVIGPDGGIELSSDRYVADSSMQDAPHVIYGTDHDDVLQGGMGHQIIFGGQGVDTVVEHGPAEAANITVAQADDQSQAVVVSTGPGNSDVLISVERLKFDTATYTIVTATDGSHTAQGTAADDIVVGSGHGDVLAGGGGYNVLFGSAGDTAAFAGSVDNYKLSLSAWDHVVVSGADRDGTDTLVGVASANFDGQTYALHAGTSGDDILIAGTGPELMVGGAGHDVFVFNHTIMAVHRANVLDMVADFSQGMDRIDLHWINFDPFLAGGDAFIWDGSDADNSGHGHGHGHGHVGYHVEQVDTDGWRTVIDGQANGDGNSGSDFHIMLRGHVELKQADFIL